MQLIVFNLCRLAQRLALISQVNGPGWTVAIRVVVKH